MPGTQQPAELKTTVSKPVALKYLVYTPAEYGVDPQRRWPLILFLHGSGERGTELGAVKKHGLPAFLDSRPDFPFVVVSPQCPDGIYYDNDALTALLDKVEADYAVDRSRVYLTGLSMGGWGAYQLACAHPERFAAVAPVSGWGLEDLASSLKDVPVWAFHGADDPYVPLDWDQRMVNEVNKTGGHAKLTVYPGKGHNVWPETFGNQELYDWFLEHKRAR